MGVKEPVEDTRLSHSICTECHEYFSKQLKGLSLDEYLENFGFPVFIVNKDNRIVAANKAAEKVTGKSSKRVSGLLSGKAMECIYARLPEGCGYSVHCETCTIRRAVTSTMKTGIPKSHVPVKLRQEKGDVQMVISVNKMDNAVRMVIEEIAPLDSA